MFAGRKVKVNPSTDGEPLGLRPACHAVGLSVFRTVVVGIIVGDGSRHVDTVRVGPVLHVFLARELLHVRLPLLRGKW
jgi:hypothetical protein